MSLEISLCSTIARRARGERPSVNPLPPLACGCSSPARTLLPSFPLAQAGWRFRHHTSKRPYKFSPSTLFLGLSRAERAGLAQSSRLGYLWAHRYCGFGLLPSKNGRQVLGVAVPQKDRRSGRELGSFTIPRVRICSERSTVRRVNEPLREPKRKFNISERTLPFGRDSCVLSKMEVRVRARWRLGQQRRYDGNHRPFAPVQRWCSLTRGRQSLIYSARNTRRYGTRRSSSRASGSGRKPGASWRRYCWDAPTRVWW